MEMKASRVIALLDAWATRRRNLAVHIDTDPGTAAIARNREAGSQQSVLTVQPKNGTSTPWLHTAASDTLLGP